MEKIAFLNSCNTMCPFCYTAAYFNGGHFYSILEAYDLVELNAKELVEGEGDNESYFVYKCEECSSKRLTYHICTEHVGGVREIYL